MKRIRSFFKKELLTEHLVLAGIVTMLAATALGAIALPLEIESGLDVSRFLAGKDQSQVLQSWRDYHVVPLAYAYLLLDALLFVPAYVIFLIGLAMRLKPPSGSASFDRLLGNAAIATTLAGMLFDEIENALGLRVLISSDTGWGRALGVVSGLKWTLLSIAVLCLITLVIRWLFAIGPSYRDATTQRAHLRTAALDILWRNRYNLIGLALFTGLVVLMNQSRDVLVGIAQALESRQWLGAAVIMFLSAAALWMFAWMAWLSARILGRLQRHGDRPLFGAAVRPAPSRTHHEMARWWARLVGATPLLVLVWLSGIAARDAARSQAVASMYILLVFGLLTIGGAIGFLWRRHARRWTKAGVGKYYDSTPYLLRPTERFKPAGEWEQKRYRFFGIPAAQLALPLIALLAVTILRGVDLSFPNAPSIALIVICLGMTFWLGVTSLLTQLSLVHGRPYILVVLVVVALLGWGGCTDNHAVWTAISGPASMNGQQTMWYYQASLAAVVLVAALLACRVIRANHRKARGERDAEGRRKRPDSVTLANNRKASGYRLSAIVIGALAGFVVILWLADRHGPRALAAQDGQKTTASLPSSAPAQTNAAQSRPSLDKALVQWLGNLCSKDDRCATDKPLPVYFVSAEGGGIRAAYWTALVLAELTHRIPDFEARTFSISGVSGGAIGASIYRVCLLQAASPAEIMTCVRRLGEAHLLGPLLGSWTFEDMLARVVPTYFCNSPGCGIMSRGAWFEQGMEDVWPALREPLAGGRARSGDRHLPYLLLNGTWVETGERAIASDLRIEPAHFPTARDQIALLGKDLPLSTAAHNAARFPYVNAIGSLRTMRSLCPVKRDDSAEDKEVSCGHLADGGYFDNSGGHSTADVLRALGGILQAPSESGLNPNLATWLHRNLMPQVIMIRNGLERKSEPKAGSQEKKDPHSCGATEPELPRCKGRFWLMTDLFGPAVAAFNATGIGSNGRLAESLLRKEVLAVRPRPLSPEGRAHPVVELDLEKEGILYPLGWYLSPMARKGMENEACTLDVERYKRLCASDDRACLAQAGRPAQGDSC